MTLKPLGLAKLKTKIQCVAHTEVNVARRGNAEPQTGQVGIEFEVVNWCRCWRG